MRRLMESTDVSKELDIAAATVRAAVRAGRLRPFAVTFRGSRLFRPKDLEPFRRWRQEQLDLRRVRPGLVRSPRLGGPVK
jgi:hypothetical protein